MKKLTLCIPTYNRNKSVEALVESIISSGLLDSVSLIVIDDGSVDKTHELLKRKCSGFHESVKIIRYDTNKGMANGLFRFFEECQTEYLMMLADDDIVIPQGVRELIDYLEKRAPDFASTTWLANATGGSRVFRGRAREARIKLAEIRTASNHAPGLVYRVPAVLPDLGFLRQRLVAGCYATMIFPQVVIALSLALRTNNCWWCPIASGGYHEDGAKPSGLRDRDGNHWSSVIGRWNEQKAFSDVYSYFYSIAPSFSVRKAVERLGVLHELESFERLKSGIAVERPDLVPLINGASAYQNLRHLLRTCFAFYRYLSKRIYCAYKLRGFSKDS